MNLMERSRSNRLQDSRRRFKEIVSFFVVISCSRVALSEDAGRRYLGKFSIKCSLERNEKARIEMVVVLSVQLGNTLASQM